MEKEETLKMLQNMQVKTASWANCCNKTIDKCICKTIEHRIWVV